MNDKDYNKAADNTDPNDIAALIAAEVAKGKKAAVEYVVEAERKEAEALQREKDAEAKNNEEYFHNVAKENRAKIARIVFVGLFLLVLGIGIVVILRIVRQVW
jgi:cytoplasmic iron level regulating protein YaaA (DUF328/UPF0246 family)